MKKNSLGLKTFGYLAIFTSVILLLVWILQVEFLQYSYEKYSMNQIEHIASKIKGDNKIDQHLENYAYENNMCIQYYTGDDVVSYNTKNPRCILDAKNAEVTKYKRDLVTSDQDYIKLISPTNKVKSIIYKVELDDNNYVILNTTLEDMDSASKLLQHQLIYLILICIAVSIILSIFISRRINRPIVKMIDSARQLSKGKYDVKFEKSNITELDELADVLTVASSEMNKTDELRRDLISNVSHDLKTPLTMIKAYAEKVRDLTYKDPEKREKDLNIIISETDRLNNLVNDLLDLSKLEDGKQAINIEEYDLVKEIKEIMKRYDIIKDENYKLKLDLPKEAIIKADKSKLDQVIYNLINNAIEHTGEDLTVKISVIPQKEGYLVSIKDSGKGIPKEEIPLVWNKYYKKEKNHKRNIIGSGIGLSIVKKVLEQHNFEYGINSEVNKYTEFYFKVK